ncbi:hypothetical protein LCL95_03975 [Bacillus timonensis]|nr:hypothetical protein [Bacillus timonensis]
MAFGINREELLTWKKQVNDGKIAFLTHYWQHPRYEHIKTVTKVGCSDLEKLIAWGYKYNLKKEWIHNRLKYPHFDLIGEIQKDILKVEGLEEHIQKFRM